MHRKRLLFRGAFHAFATLIACGFASPAPADPAAPAQESECEIRANRFAAQHPHADGFDALKHGFFSFTGAKAPEPPSTYRDPASGITFYVESDGRHLAAIDKHGTLLWVRNPYVDGDECPYRSAHPYIAWIGPPAGVYGRPVTPEPDATANARVVKDLNGEIDEGLKANRPKAGARFIGLSFNSSQFGFVNIANGDFYPQGQN